MPSPLQGLQVVDLSRTGPGQWATTTLADLGAQVTAIEQPGFVERRTRGGSAQAGFGISIGRNKRSILVNLADPRGHEVFMKLVGGADIVMESFRPGTATKLGVDYAAVSTVNPQVIYCSLSGFGQTGPYARMPAHDIQFEAVSGMLKLDESGRPKMPENVWADRQATSNAVAALLAAVVARERFGVGQYLDLAFLDPAVTLPSGHIDEMLQGAYPCYRVYECADGRFVALGIREPWFWERLCRYVGKLEWTEHQRPEGTLRAEMQAFFDLTFRSHTRDEWVQIFLEQDIEGAPVNIGVDVYYDPQIKERGMLLVTPGSEHPQLASPLKLSKTPWKFRTSTAQLGEHTGSVLKELGYDSSVIESLRQDGVIG